MITRNQIYISGLRDGDEAIFHEIFKMFHSRLCFFASRITGDNIAIEDIVQDAFLKLWHKRTDFDSLAAIQSFLYVSVRNSCLNDLKHQQVVKSKMADIQIVKRSELEEPDIIEPEVLDKLFRAISALPDGCRSVLHLGYFQKMKNQEIAEYLKISINTVKTQKKRALHLLRGFLKYPACWLFFLFN